MTDLAVVNTLANGAPPGIGHNNPPLAEQLLDELANDRSRADALIAAAAGCSIASDLDAANVATLVKLIRDHERSLDKAREARKQPFLADCRIVDAVFGAAMRPLVQARAGADGKGGLSGMLTAWERKREEEASRDRQRILVEQRAREEEAERAREAADAAKAKGNGSVAAELAALRATEEADALRRQAETLKPEPIRTLTGAVTTRREIAFEMTDSRKLLGWLLKTRKNEIEQAARTIVGKHLQSLGVEAVERGSVDIPGVTARVERHAQVR